MGKDLETLEEHDFKGADCLLWMDCLHIMLHTAPELLLAESFTWFGFISIFLQGSTKYSLCFLTVYILTIF